MDVDPEYVIILDIRSSYFEMIFFFAFVGIIFVRSNLSSQMRQGNRDSQREIIEIVTEKCYLHLKCTCGQVILFVIVCFTRRLNISAIYLRTWLLSMCVH